MFYIFCMYEKIFRIYHIYFFNIFLRMHYFLIRIFDKSCISSPCSLHVADMIKNEKGVKVVFI